MEGRTTGKVTEGELEKGEGRYGEGPKRGRKEDETGRARWDNSALMVVGNIILTAIVVTLYVVV